MAHIHARDLNAPPTNTKNIKSMNWIIPPVISVFGGAFLLWISPQPINLMFSIARLFCGMIIIGLLPGFLFTLALFPKQQMINFLERVGISLVLNIAILGLIGYGLSLTSWGLTYVTIIITISLINLALSIVVFIQRKIFNVKSYRFAIYGLNWRIKLNNWRNSLLSFILLGAILLVVFSILIAAVSPANIESYTEFFILEHQKLGSKSQSYSVGDYITATLFIENHENKETIYHIIIVDPDNKYSRIASVLLGSQERYAQDINMKIIKTGDNQAIQFLLYREGEGDPYRSLRLWITVTGPPNQ